MPHTWSTALKTHCAQSGTTLSIQWRITRRDGTVIGATNHPADIVHDGVTYLASSGMMPTAIMSRSSVQVDQAEIKAFIDSVQITEDDLRGGLYHHALVEIFCLNYKDLTMGEGFLGKGRIGNVTVMSDGTFSAEFRSLDFMLSQQVCRSTSVTCRAKRLGDGFGLSRGCGVDTSGVDAAARDIRQTGTVSAVGTDNISFTVTDFIGAGVNFFKGGVIEWVSADSNSNLASDVIAFDSATGIVTLFQPMPFPIEVGHTLIGEEGCDRRIETCKNTFDAVIYFDGEPYITGPVGANSVTEQD